MEFSDWKKVLGAVLRHSTVKQISIGRIIEAGSLSKTFRVEQTTVEVGSWQIAIVKDAAMEIEDCEDNLSAILQHSIVKQISIGQIIEASSLSTEISC